MVEIIKEVLITPYLFQSLGMVAACSMFISPVLYNGDYRGATKSIVVLLGYATFVGLMIASHAENITGEVFPEWIRYITILILIAASYINGLYLGVYIHNKTKK